MVGRKSAFSCINGTCPLRFETTVLENPYLVRGLGYDRSSDVYTCQTSGPHLFTFSVGIQAGEQVSTETMKTHEHWSALPWCAILVNIIAQRCHITSRCHALTSHDAMKSHDVMTSSHNVTWHHMTWQSESAWVSPSGNSKIAFFNLATLTFDPWP